NIMERERFVKVLDAQLAPALGCTDPVGLAYGAASARSYVGGDLLALRAQISVNLIKNAAAVCIPKTDGRCGIPLALALGVIGGDHTKGLEVLSSLTQEQILEAEKLTKTDVIKSSLADTEKSLYLCVEIETTEGTAKVVIEDNYLNVTSVTVNGEIVFAAQADDETDGSETNKSNLDFLSIASILEFASTATEEELWKVEKAIDMNMAVSEAGMDGKYGIGSGAFLGRMMASGSVGSDWMNETMMRTMCAVDTRMAGADMAVMSNTGSGNQGLTCTIPVASLARYWNKSHLEVLRSTAISCLMAVHIKKNFGILGAVCGAVIASAAVSCGMIYLMGGGEREMLQAMKSVLGDVAGLMCDGAKAGCAIKVGSCIHSAMMAAALAMDHRGIQGTDGIVGETEQDMIDNFVRVSKEGMSKMDRVVLEIILNK
ncbi:MAG: serine dehydratase subunit alpha family protein, partial [Firmicutes bacterium]|nr:serine dehydratase subunit alpha family protein [Bacillota bacterium]